MGKFSLVGLVIFIVGLLLLVLGFVGTTRADVQKAVSGTVTNHDYQKDVTKFNRVEVSGKVDVEIVSGSKYSVHVYEDKKGSINTSVDDQVLKINNKRSAFNGNFVVKFKNNKLTFGSSMVVITVPDNQLKSIEGNNNSGDLGISKMRSNDSLNINGFSVGDIRLTQVSAKSLSIDTQDADITIADSHFNGNDSTLKTENGDMHINNSSFKALNAALSDGDAHLNNLNIATNLNVNNTDGDVYLALVKNYDADVYAHSSYGNIYGSVAKHADSKKHYRIISEDGDIHLND